MYGLYYSMFSYDFNLGFSHPAKDVCSEYVKFRLQPKDRTLTEEEKCIESAMFILYRCRARRFYDILNDVGNSFTVCFDIMENLVLSKTLIGQTYYSCQLYLFVFGVVHHPECGQLQRKENSNLFA